MESREEDEDESWTDSYAMLWHRNLNLQTIEWVLVESSGLCFSWTLDCKKEGWRVVKGQGQR